MSTTYSFSSTELFPDFFGKFHSRKLLIQNPLNEQPVTAAHPYSSESSLNSNAVIVLSVLVCGIICSLGLHFLIRCILVSWSRLEYSGPRANSSTPLAKTGIKKKALKAFTIVKYSGELKLPGLDNECVICLSDFAPGERVRILPKCNHGFHVRCIDKWLRSNSSCPKCRHCLIESCKQIEGSTQPSSLSGISTPVQETVVNIRPLEPEGILRNYEGLS
ncbi:E3 ubiquitin-protein ligase ATL76 [Citrus sinensis]|uniref:E3 ubiquitin-protein ligase ATL76-like n=1 Tax=Citrus sinensis TaxID=2711 RepID=UPI0003D7672C|nr:E3 ubiquitin-protein ligase ATL76-like [Citrus sinensis]XP_024036067.1 E3 ubiquitin-protein ligase ATL76 [Citrus x clementina]KAH9669229.1 E3 ubiquitin-protein ligase ATL76 [Citrus sinensis]